MNYTSAKPYFYGTGRRKKSIARVRIYPGSGQITINKRDIDDYFGLDTLKLIVRQPLELTGNMGKFDIVCNVIGGGVDGGGSFLKADGAGHPLSATGVHVHAHSDGRVSTPTARQRQLGYLSAHMAAKTGNQ